MEYLNNYFSSESDTFIESTIISVWNNIDNTKKRIIYIKIQEHGQN